jgi:hypothetical protein
MRHIRFAGLFSILLVLTPAAAHSATIFYQAGFTDDLFRIDTVSGVETKVGDMGVADSWGFSFSPTGTLYGFNRSTASLYTINTSTAALTLVGATTLSSVEAMTFDATGSTLFVTSNSTLYSLNPLNAAATAIGSIGTSLDGLTVSPTALTVSGLGAVAAGTVFGVDSGNLYTINTTTPSSTFVGGVGAADETLAFGSDGTLYGHNDAGTFSTINLATLTSTSVATTSNNFVFASAVQPAAVPEPSSLALLGIGVLGLAACCWRRKRTMAA